MPFANLERARNRLDPWTLVLGLGYFAAAVLSIEIYRFGHGVVGFWIPNVLALALLLRHRFAPAWLPYILTFGASVAANLATGSSPASTLMFSAANTVEVWLSVTLVVRSGRTVAAGGDRVADYVTILSLAGGVAPALVGGVFSLCTWVMLDWPFLTSLTSWWSGDALGYAIFLPLLLLLSPRAWSMSDGDGRLLKLAGATIGCALFAIAAVLWTHYPFVLIIVPLMLAAAYFPPFYLAVISACVGTTVVAVGVQNIVPGLAGVAGAYGGFQLSIAITVALPFLASLLMKQIRRDQRLLRESEQRFRRAMEDSAIGMALVGLDGRILEANRAFSDMLGFTVAELQAKTFFDITYPEDFTIGRETVRRALSGEADAYRFEKRYVRKDGVPIWALLAGSVIRDHETGAPLYLVSQIEDIDARKKSESLLKEAEGRWSFALESAGQGVWDFDRRKERTYYSPVWKQILGYGEDELGEDPWLWLDLTHPEDRERVRIADSAHLAGETPSFEAEFRMRHKDGHWIWVHDRGKVLERDADGAPIRAIGTHTDITRQKEAEARIVAAAQELTDERERLRITLHSIADAVICTDAANNITFMNPAAEALTGFDIVTAYGEPLDAAYCPVDEETGERMVPTTGSNEGSGSSNHHGRAVLVRPDDTRRNIREIVSPILTAKGDVAGSVIVFQDITDARALQRDLAYAASHDSLTGLANRSGFSHALLAVLDEARAEGSENALLFVDLDRFKAVNDSAGHVAGDALLKKVAAKIKGKVRSNDVVARFGGDEFAILLRSCSLAAARSIAESLVVAVRDLDFTWEGSPYQIGASIGIAPITAESGEPEEIVTQADEACYASKAAGRGRVSIFEAPSGAAEGIAAVAEKQAQAKYPKKLAS